MVTHPAHGKKKKGAGIFLGKWALSPKNDPLVIRETGLGHGGGTYVLSVAPIHTTYLAHQRFFSNQDLLCFDPKHTRGAACHRQKQNKRNKTEPKSTCKPGPLKQQRCSYTRMASCLEVANLGPRYQQGNASSETVTPSLALPHISGGYKFSVTSLLSLLLPPYTVLCVCMSSHMGTSRLGACLHSTQSATILMTPAKTVSDAGIQNYNNSTDSRSLACNTNAHFTVWSE